MQNKKLFMYLYTKKYINNFSTIKFKKEFLFKYNKIICNFNIIYQ